MKFFTDQKYDSGVALSEYETYCRANWDLIPIELKIISEGMLPEDMLLGIEQVSLHDARILTTKTDDSSVTLELITDHEGGLRKVWLEYRESKMLKKPSSAVLDSKKDDSDNDIMCHEIGLELNGRYTHALLFASGEELQIQFSKLLLVFKDVG